MNTGVLFVDARYARDFQSGHLKGAVSLPVDANDNQFRAVTKDLARTRRVVVYAQSRGCPYARSVAGRLVEDGFRNVTIFRGGWTEWTAKNGQPVAKEAQKGNGDPRG